MPFINTFKFDKSSFNDIKEYRFGKNWPVVYIAENGQEVYVGETTNVFSRSKQHYENVDRRRLKNIHVVTDEEFNKSAALDIESWLIQYMSADGKFILQNGNRGLQNHNYFERDKYKAKFEILWEKLIKEKRLASHSLSHLKNTDVFKYSPYKTLSEDQLQTVKSIVTDLVSELVKSTYIVNGKPGTGKTVLATYLFKYLAEDERTKNWKIALVVPMTSLRKTLKKVFRNIKGLSAGMVIGPSEVVRENYDLLIVDEAHRLRRRRNITNYKVFDDINNSLGLGAAGTELDWIVSRSKHQILFYDINQSVRPSDIPDSYFKKLEAKEYTLASQMRIEGAGDDFVHYIDTVFSPKNKNKKYSFRDYDFRVYKNIHELVSDIKQKNIEHGLARMVAGYAWPWNTKHGKQDYDIEIDGLQMIWNSSPQDWVNSENSINEVGSIHTIQGYDLNYVGVIIGPELTYDKETEFLKVNKKKYFDIKGHAGVTDINELEQYIINIYKTLLTRGIKGCFVYCVDPALRKRFESLLINN
jgi:uncharacterized protein